MVLTFNSVDKTLVCNHSNESYWWGRSLCCTRWFELLSLWIKPKRATIQIKAIEQCFHAVLLNYYVFNNSKFHFTWIKPWLSKLIIKRYKFASLWFRHRGIKSFSLFPSNLTSTVCARKDRGDVWIGVRRLDERKVSSATEACVCPATKKQWLSLLGLHHMLKRILCFGELWYYQLQLGSLIRWKLLNYRTTDQL